MNHTKRFFAIHLTLAAAISLFTCFSGTARADTIAISLPISGEYAELGRNFRTGLKLAVEQLGITHELFIADDGCDADLAHIAAKDIKALNPSMVMGMICNQPAIAIATELADSDIPVLVAGARSPRLIKDRGREEWNLWRMSVGDDYPVTTAAEAIVRLWKQKPYAIVDDGTIYGRSFTDLLRQKMREAGLEPQFSDTFRSAQSTQAGLLRRLQRSGVSAAFIASSTVEDLFTIVRDAKQLGIDLDIIATEALAVLPFLEEADLVSTDIKVIAPAFRPNPVLEQLLARENIRSDIHHYMGFAAMQIAQQALAKKQGDAPIKMDEITFRTVLGSIKFNADGSADYNPYRLMNWNGVSLNEYCGN